MIRALVPAKITNRAVFGHLAPRSDGFGTNDLPAVKNQVPSPAFCIKPKNG